MALVVLTERRSGRRGRRAGASARRRQPRLAARAGTWPPTGVSCARCWRRRARSGAELRYWSPWNEPDHPYFISPQRQRCDRTAPSAAVGPYVAMARVLQAALAAAPGEQQLVLGELAGLDERRPKTTSVSEFVAGSRRSSPARRRSGPSTATSAAATSADDLERALERKGCARPEQIWITETGVGAPRSGEQRRTTPAAQKRACARLHRRLVRWYRDPRVTAAFQYTFREDDLFPTGLVSTDLKARLLRAGRVAGLGHERPPRAHRPAAAELLLLRLTLSRPCARCTGAHAPLRLRRLRQLLQGPSAARAARARVRAGAGRHLRRRHADRRLRARSTRCARRRCSSSTTASGSRSPPRSSGSSPRARRSCPRTPRARAGRAVAVVRAGADHGRASPTRASGC